MKLVSLSFSRTKAGYVRILARSEITVNLEEFWRFTLNLIGVDGNSHIKQACLKVEHVTKLLRFPIVQSRVRDLNN
jgi:hypothetical protein